MNDMVMVPRDKVVIVTENHGGYLGGRCIACGDSGWIHQIKHKKTCPMLAAAPPAQPYEPDGSDAPISDTQPLDEDAAE